MQRHAAPLEKGARANGLTKPAVPKYKVREASDDPISIVPVATKEQYAKFQGSTAKPADKRYTGTKMLGVGTMHKSNSVPLFSQEEAIEVATMRRN